MKLKYSPYSNSKINLFYQCNFRWYLKYIDKIYVPMPTHYFEKGNFYHYILEHFPNFPPKNFNFKFADKDKQEQFITNVKSFIGLPEINDLLTKFSLKREQTCGLNKNWEFESKRKLSLFTGYIDYLGKEHDDEIIVGDWKSSMRYTPNLFQLQLYALWVFSVMPEIKKVKAGFLYIEDQKTDWYYFDRETNEKELKNLFINKIRKIEQCNDFKKQPSKDCERCEYYGEHCKPFNVVVPGVKNG